MSYLKFYLAYIYIMIYSLSNYNSVLKSTLWCRNCYQPYLTPEKTGRECQWPAEVWGRKWLSQDLNPGHWCLQCVVPAPVECFSVHWKTENSTFNKSKFINLVLHLLKFLYLRNPSLSEYHKYDWIISWESYSFVFQTKIFYPVETVCV